MHRSFFGAALVALAAAQTVLAGIACKAQGIPIELRTATSAKCSSSNIWKYGGNGHLTTTSVLPKDAELLKETTTAGATYICDHVVELSMVKSVMEEPGGACELAAAMTNKADAMQKLQAIRQVANARSNLAFFDTRIESKKGQSVQSMLGSGSDPLTSMNVWELGALHDYVTRCEGTASAAAALAIDAAISAQFSTAPTGVAALWGTWVGKVTAAWTAEEAIANHQIKQLVQAANANAAKAANCGTTTSTGATGTTTKRATKSRNIPLMDRSSLSGSSRFVRRYVPSFIPIADTPVVQRATSARARGGAARSGPHAPPAPSCPIKGQTQKSVVKRSATKQKASRTTNPRVPAQRPASKKPDPRKQVAKRPADRARRTPGVQKKRTRVTPKKKPKVVPRPARKPKGKARSRRR